MEKSKFSVMHKDESTVELVRKNDHKTLAVWAIDCVERVMPYFEEKYPEYQHPRNAIEILQTGINTGVFKMAEPTPSLGTYILSKYVLHSPVVLHWD